MTGPVSDTYIALLMDAGFTDAEAAREAGMSETTYRRRKAVVKAARAVIAKRELIEFRQGTLAAAVELARIRADAAEAEARRLRAEANLLAVAS